MGDWITKLILIPMFAIIGIYIVGQLISDLFGIPDSGKILFWAVGGIGFFALYFKALLSNW